MADSEVHVVLEKLCDCAKKHRIEQIVTCDDSDEAYETALAIAEKCNNRFCGKHGFDIDEVGEHFVISVEDGGFAEACELY